MKIITVLGARPQFIKASALSRAISRHNELNPEKVITEIILHTGQHFDHNMSQTFFEDMAIPKPTYNLDINSLSHGAMTGRMLEKIEKILLTEKPDWVIVYGDTNSTLAGALAASKLHIPVAHIESGLRSFNMKMPEEINRILTDQISKILFCPNDTALENLNKEGFVEKPVSVVKTGDIMLDSALHYKNSAIKPKSLISLDTNFAVLTMHRAENTDNPQRLNDYIENLLDLCGTQKVVFAIHPRTAAKLAQFNIQFEHENLFKIDPVGYLEMIWLLDNCSLVLTDSGGLQKEAFFFHKPCVTLRSETEWTELVEVGANILCPEPENLLLSVSTQLKRSINYNSALYGCGSAAQQIVETLTESNHV
ncbi:MAG: UDP-N-acetylglucosamine 2-epimerase (non-hydrolyzing) [Lentisphaeraceae bacterium]|nr:UDP-N-acetylglucosamine 2-epimerase (non-hydrolyzing) [Lentisphaeraceae bacterium]